MGHFQAMQHKMLHIGEKPYACTVFEQKFRQEKTLKDMKRTFACSFCDKKLLEHSMAKQHEMMHTGEKPSVLNKN